jgi:UDP-N-acetylglucosamine--N-acetylmuramyl-(pentapeptide) pyrophosphoryl-undecaprenol N-acetylglucosamine transferase
MASLLNRPLAIHEQNAVAGTTTRLLAHIADRVLSSFESAFERRRGVVLTGNPIRSSFTRVAPPAARYAQREGRLRLLILGGSLGAQALNEAVPRALALLPASARPQVIHQSGRQHIDPVREIYASAGIDARCEPFVEDMASELAAADLVVCRAGATTLAELAAVGVGSILVPFPHAIDDHQTRNAEALTRARAALLLPQAELTPHRLAAMLRSLDRTQLLEMACAAHGCGRPDAARDVADICAQLAVRS